MFHSKITRRLVTSFLLIVLVSLSLLGIILLNYFRDYTMQQEKNALILNAKIIETYPGSTRRCRSSTRRPTCA